MSFARRKLLYKDRKDISTKTHTSGKEGAGTEPDLHQVRPGWGVSSLKVRNS
jgi:hypothetical protein